MSNQIVISKGNTSITMPLTRKISYGGISEEKQATMASKKIVTDIIGFRRTVSAEWDWVPAETITALISILRQGGFFSVTYPTPEGTRTDTMSVNFPTLEIFAYRSGVAIWHGVRLDMQTQDVTLYASS